LRRCGHLVSTNALDHIVARQLFANISAATLFLQEWLQRPQQIGAILPSSRNLADAMADWLPADPDEFVVELGPGTGSVTQAMFERGLRHDRLIAIEKSPKLAGLLRERFPRARVITGDAEQLDKLVKRHVRRAHGVGAVISSLPLRNFAPEAARTVSRKIHDVLRPEGKWVQYSYHLGGQRPKGALSFNLISSDVVWWNLPPARISVFQKPASL
jgi:phospholipid N-methyltransferase